MKKKIIYTLIKNKEFSLLYWIIVNAITINLQSHIPKLHRLIEYKRYEGCKNYLRKYYGNIIEEFRGICNQLSQLKSVPETISSDAPIWVFWAQGEENAPYPVKNCIKSIVRHTGKRNIHILNMYNYQEYVSLPQYIEDKFRKGLISYAHFADILRLALLKSYGGIWLDSTFYMCNEFPINLDKYAFYSINQNGVRNWIVTKDKWSIGFLASGKDNVLVDYWYRFILEYWRKENVAIAYLISDCMLAVGYEDIPYIQEMVEKVPVNNPDAFIFTGKEQFGNIINDDKIFTDLINSNFVFQLSYKQDYRTEILGKKTFFGRMLEK